MRTIIYFAIVIVAMTVAGCHSTKESEVEELRELVEIQNKALDKAWVLIDKHDLLDKDGSDDMADYLEYNSVAYKKYNGEQQ